MIKIIFNHHDTFKSAKIDWDRRIKRIDLDKILVVVGINDFELQYSSKYKEIDYPKIALCNHIIDNDETMFETKYMNVGKYPARSRILGFSGLFGRRRFDFLPYVKMIKEIIEKDEKNI